jgi:TldD protein
MLKLAQNILGQIPNVTYADVRIVDFQSREIATKDGVVEALAEGLSIGYGIRILKDGAWGFASSHDMTPRGIEKTIKKAMEICEASVRNSVHDIVLAEQKGVVGHYKTPIKKDPFSVHLDEIAAMLLTADNAQRVHKNIAISQAFFTAHKEKKYFASTNGSLIDQEIVWTGAGIEASAADDHDFQNRSYPNSFRGQNVTRGYELIDELDLAGHAPKVAEEAVALLTAPLCPTETTDIILDSNQLALQIHESCGHATELDRVLGDEASYAGTSFLTPEKLGNFKYGSDIVNLTADATIPGGLGTFGFDDEGTPATRTYLVKNGLFNDYLTSRETVKRLKEVVPTYDRPSNGTVRASSWSRLPMIRMTNVNLEPGTWKLSDLIKDTSKGIFMSTNRSWSIDDRRLNFQFGTEIAWEIKDGKLGKMMKNPTYQGMTPQFWNSCDAICNKDEWTVWGTPNCGKGQPSQVMYTGHGASPARFRNIKVGVVKKW